MNTPYVLKPEIIVYTDGSCHTTLLTGAWAAFIFIDGVKKIRSGTEKNTSHHRMELKAVIEAILYLGQQFPFGENMAFITDSQYVMGLIEREAKLKAQGFVSKKGNETRNVDLVKQFYSVKNEMNITFTKIKAHQKNSGVPQYNNEVDQFCRSLLRATIDDDGK